MKRIIKVMMILSILAVIIEGCSSNDNLEEDNSLVQNEQGTNENKKDSTLEEIPREYFSSIENGGTLVELYYDTYESITYEQKTKKLNKRAIVYLPYEYNENEKYNVFYLMHGGWGNETTQLGSPNNPSSFKNVIDNAIANAKIAPLIIVCPTYNNESTEDSGNYSLAFNTLTVNYHNELINDLIPVVDETYSTRADRDHRAFAGFSMGSVTTWYTFVNCLDEFRYFLPMSGAMDYQGDSVDAAVTASGYSPEDFFIFAITGTDDFEYQNFTNQMEGMLGMPSGNFVEGENVVFLVKEGYSHDGRAAMEYTYNGLLYFWNSDKYLTE